MKTSERVAIVGGCGHVGLPLGLALADAGMSVLLYDIDHEALDRVGAGKMPFFERGADEVLARVLANGNLMLTSDAGRVGEVDHVVVVVGTPVDEHLNPDPGAV
ncbi:MAG: nucleotide sugar dehydrogenase, partial [Acidimicrobiales bacterium]|nr:nucleotide sugar dehydrogenase [Acidimicrobiales bacterium]